MSVRASPERELYSRIHHKRRLAEAEEGQAEVGEPGGIRDDATRKAIETLSERLRCLTKEVIQDRALLQSAHEQMRKARRTQLDLSYVLMANTLYQLFLFICGSEPNTQRMFGESHSFRNSKMWIRDVQDACAIIFRSDSRAQQVAHTETLMDVVDKMHNTRNAYMHPRSVHALMDQVRTYAAVLQDAIDHGDPLNDEYRMMHRVFTSIDAIARAELGSFKALHHDKWRR